MFEFNSESWYQLGNPLVMSLMLAQAHNEAYNELQELKRLLRLLAGAWFISVAIIIIFKV